MAKTKYTPRRSTGENWLHKRPKPSVEPLDRVKAAFEAPYKGSTHELFIEKLKKQWIRHCEEYDYPNLSMVVAQSSGVGKSRMIEEMSKLVFTIPLNLRLRTSADVYPPPDVKLRDYIYEKWGDKSDLKQQAEFAILLRFLFEKATELITSPLFREQGQQNLAGAWAEYLNEGRTAKTVGPNREAFVNEVVERAHLLRQPNARKQKIWGALGDNWGDYLRAKRNHSEKQREEPELTHSAVDDEDILGKNLNKLIKLLEVACGGFVEALSCRMADKTSNICVVSLDQAELLFDWKTGFWRHIEHYPNNLYGNLMRVLSKIADYPVFFVIATTKLPCIPERTVSPHSIQSWDLRPGVTLPFPPFTEFPADLYAADALVTQLSRQATQFRSLRDPHPTVPPPINTDQVTLEDLCSMNVVAGFGRASWYSFREQCTSVRFPAWADGEMILDYARERFGADWEDSLSLLANLDVRIELEFDQEKETSWDLEVKLIHQRARIYQPPGLQKPIHATSRSEPLLAEVAARHLNRSPDQPMEEFGQGAKELSQVLDTGIIAHDPKRRRGQLCGRLLVTAAHDIAVQRHYMGHFETETNQPYFHRPVPTLLFLRSLFADKFHQTILEAEPIDKETGAPSLSDTFKDSFVFFSHFGAVEDSNDLSPELVLTALRRGMALRVKDTQTSVHAVIPVHIGSVSSPLSAETTSTINLQFFNRKRAEACYLDRRVTVPDLTIPTLSVILELGDQDSSRSEEELVRSRLNQPGTYYDNNHYVIVAYGCGPDTFNVIPRNGESLKDDKDDCTTERCEQHYKNLLGQGNRASLSG